MPSHRDSECCIFRSGLTAHRHLQHPRARGGKGPLGRARRRAPRGRPHARGPDGGGEIKLRKLPTWLSSVSTRWTLFAQKSGTAVRAKGLCHLTGVQGNWMLAIARDAYKQDQTSLASGIFQGTKPSTKPAQMRIRIRGAWLKLPCSNRIQKSLGEVNRLATHRLWDQRRVVSSYLPGSRAS